MAEKKRALEIILSGKMDSSLTRACGRASAMVSRYQRMLGGAATSQRALGSASAFSAGGLLRSATGYLAAYVGVQQLTQGVVGCVQAFQESATEENRLYQLMTRASGATRAQVQAMKAYAKQLMGVTTLEDETTMRGIGQLSTFRLQTRSLRALTPALQDLIVGQFGLNATSADAQKAGNMLGKVFVGQASALRRYGISFTKAQEKILKTGNEQQRVAMLTKVIAQNYGGLARRMAQTPEGRVKQLANAWGDVKEEVGAQLMPVIMQVFGQISKNLPQIKSGVMALTGAFLQLLPPAVKLGTFIGKNWRWIVPLIAGIVAAIGAWKVSLAVLAIQQAALNLAMSANPIGLIIVAIGALIGIIAALVMNWDKVKAALSRVWTWFVKFGTEGPGRFIPIVALIALIAKNWDKVKAAAIGVWNWFKKIFGIGMQIGKMLFRNSPLGMLIRGGQWAAGKLAGRRAAGGPVGAGRSYLVGERGPELFTPSLSGRISPNLAMAGAGGINVTFAPVINIGGSADRNEVAAGVRSSFNEFKANMKQFLEEQRRRGFR